MEKIWLQEYPEGVPAMIDVAAYGSLVELLETAFRRYAARTAFTFMGKSISFAEVDRLSQALGAYLQSIGLARGDRVAVMLPNVPQYPVAIAAILRAGYTLVNVNPMYTPRELEHQLNDSGAKALVVLENFAASFASIAAQVPVRTVIVASMGDLLGLKGALVNFVVRKVKKMVPPYSLPGALRFSEALAQGSRLTLKPAAVSGDDIAVLQYTGGTTGVSKGAMLLHRNLVANLLQIEAWYHPGTKRMPADGQFTNVCALPIFHVFGFTVCVMLGAHMGARNILVANPRDLKSIFVALKNQTFHAFPGVNTLFNAIASHPDFGTVNWSHLVLSLGGGAAVQSGTAALWLEKTGCAIIEGYGLSETSPVATCNRADSTTYTGTIGLPLPNTELALLDDDGKEVAPGAAGEIAIRGPQVMKGYWGRDDETARVMTADGYFRTGDIGVVDARGYFKIVDRKKDMILVSGFNVYPAEIEDVMSRHPGVLECAVVGVPDEKTGEAVKLVVIRRHADLTEADVRKYCEEQLTAYKKPKYIEFRNELPKSNVGKVLRRELRGK